MPVIKSLNAQEILDSRGRPTVKVHCTLEEGVIGSASVPSGASSGAAEAHELRDNQPDRYGGLGCRKAVQHVNKDIADLLVGQNIGSQAELDQKMLDLDGTSNKSRLGANALLAVSIAFSRACALDISKYPSILCLMRLQGEILFIYHGQRSIYLVEGFMQEGRLLFRMCWLYQHQRKA